MMPAPTVMLDAAIHQLERKLDDNHREFVTFRIEVVEKLGAINTNLEGFRSRVDTTLAVTRWGIVLAVPIIATLLGSVGAGIWYLAKLDSRVAQIEQVQSKVASSQDAIPR